MKIDDYSTEKIMANEFIIGHNADINFMSFLEERKANLLRETHSDRWAKIFDYMKEHYPEVTGTLITGLAYRIEDY